jgi:hypothetical protein
MICGWKAKGKKRFQITIGTENGSKINTEPKMVPMAHKASEERI